MNPLYLEIFNQGAPWVLLVITLWVNYGFGDVWSKIWLFAMGKQLLWIAYVIYVKDWHLLPTVGGLMVVYYRNHRLWNPGSGVVGKLIFVRKTEVDTEVILPATPVTK